MSKLFKKILLLIGSGFILMFLILVSVLWAFSNNLPDYKYLKSYKAPVSSKIYSGDGELIQDFSSENIGSTVHIWSYQGEVRLKFQNSCFFNTIINFCC